MKILFFSFFFLVLVTPVHAKYILPYPSYMPGHILYRPQKIVDKLQEWWHFGLIGRAEYHRKLSDRYLIEAITLIEYRQTKLGIDALIRSNDQFLLGVLTVHDLDQKGYDGAVQRAYIVEQSVRHREVIAELISRVPAEVVWHEEKKEPIQLPLHFLLHQAEIIRKYVQSP